MEVYVLATNDRVRMDNSMVQVDLDQSFHIRVLHATSIDYRR